MAAAARTLWLSVALAASAFSWAQGAEEFRQRVERAETLPQIQDAIREAPPELRKDAGLGLEEIQELGTAGPAAAKEAILFRLDQRDRLINPPDAPEQAETAREAAQKVLDSPGYRFQEGREQGWLGQAFQRVFDAIGDFLRGLEDQGGRNPAAGFGLPPGLDRAVVTIIMVVLGIVLIGFLVFAVRRFQLQKRRSSRVGGLLSADEEELTADNWLTMADKLEREGSHREAVRCLYLASLMRLDDARVIRFLRGETNWEHEARFQRSPQKPPGVSLKEPTQLFDVIWYGYVQAEKVHVSEMRGFYTELVEALRRPQKEAS